MNIAVISPWMKYRRLVIGLAICAWAAILLYALTTNPSATETNAKLLVMKEEMDAALAHGGKVIRAYDNAKYGNALVSRLISDEDWSESLLSRYQKTLIGRGWQADRQGGLTYCKDGILTEIKPNSGVVDGVGSNYISMFYDASTIRKCA